MAENACKGPDDGPVRALREGVTVNRRSPPILVRENPAVKAGLFRVYVTVDNYRTNFDDFLGVYLFGIQVDMNTSSWVCL